MRPAIKPTFLTYTKPFLTAMVQGETPEECIDIIVNSLYDGAEAFGIQLENLRREFRDLETLKQIFVYCEGRPIYITSYRNAASEGYTDDDCADLLLLGLEAGATLCDVMGDMFHRELHEFTNDPVAVDKQKKLITQIHAKGGEVLLSTHIHDFFTEEDVLKIAKAHESRGADVVKIVNFAQTEKQMIDNILITYRLKKEMNAKFLYLANGPYSRLLRQIGPELGVCMYLCVQNYRPLNSKEQPMLRATRLVRDNMV